ncbi:MAG: site-2 protease family protein [Deltaproteobacteria bacterium]|nr:site-2 protease family protein [Deltaproteobacteria bacterium]MBI3388282.1 site-2 protease family protein [Deltaproteobacteria bacterium]
MPENIQTIVQGVCVWALPVLAAVILHELAHGVVAYWCGDDTAMQAGRLTLNPIAHIDPLGSIVIPLMLIVTGAPFLFGYAKPVPVNFGNLRNPKRDMVLVAGAGPMMNVILAILSAGVLKLIVGLAPRGEELSGIAAAVLTPLAMMAARSVGFNVVLAVFNMLPIPPLDGGRVLVGLLPRAQAIVVARLERYGMMIVFMLLMTRSLGRVINPVINLFIRVLL